MGLDRHRAYFVGVPRRRIPYLLSRVEERTVLLLAEREELAFCLAVGLGRLLLLSLIFHIHAALFVGGIGFHALLGGRLLILYPISKLNLVFGGDLTRLLGLLFCFRFFLRLFFFLRLGLLLLLGLRSSIDLRHLVFLGAFTLRSFMLGSLLCSLSCLLDCICNHPILDLLNRVVIGNDLFELTANLLVGDLFRKPFDTQQFHIASLIFNTYW